METYCVSFIKFLIFFLMLTLDQVQQSTKVILSVFGKIYAICIALVCTYTGWILTDNIIIIKNKISKLLLNISYSPFFQWGKSFLLSLNTEYKLVKIDILWLQQFWSKKEFRSGSWDEMNASHGLTLQLYHTVATWSVSIRALYAL